MPVVQPGGTGVVGLAVEVEPPAAVRPDRGRDADRLVLGQVAALLDVELHEGADPTEPRRVGADRGGVLTGPLHGVRQPDPVGVAQLEGLLGVSTPAASREPTQATPNRAPSSSPKLTIASGLVNRASRSRSRSRAANDETTPSGPSKAPPSGTESRWDPVTIAPSPCGSPSQAHWLPLRSSS